MSDAVHPGLFTSLEMRVDDCDVVIYLLQCKLAFQRRQNSLSHPSNGTDTPPSEDESLLPSPKAPTQSMVLIIRPYDGFTSRLQKHENPRVLIEGPYGFTRPLHTFSSVLFVLS